MHETARTNDPHIDLAIEEIVGLLPLPVQEDAQSALYAEWNEEFPEAISFADRVPGRFPCGCSGCGVSSRQAAFPRRRTWPGT